MTLTINESKKAAERKTRSFFKENTYYRIWAFMINDFALEKCELLVYAVIFNMYFQIGADFRGSNRYLCDLTGYKRTQVTKALKSLTDKGLLTVEFEKTPYGLHPVFTVNPRSLPQCEMFRLENASVRYADELDRKKAAEFPTA